MPTLESSPLQWLPTLAKKNTVSDVRPLADAASRELAADLRRYPSATNMQGNSPESGSKQ
eukprot:6461976-Amphidinium_carterae.5